MVRLTLAMGVSLFGGNRPNRTLPIVTLIVDTLGPISDRAAGDGEINSENRIYRYAAWKKIK